MIFGKLGGEQIAEAEIPIEQFEQSVPYYTLGAWLNLLLPLLILIWYYLKKRGEMTKKTFWMLLFIFIIWGLLTMPIGFTMG